MTKNTELFLQPDGFYAGRRLNGGKMAAGSHKISEEEIITMFTTLVRAFNAKTGQDTMMIQGDDGKAVAVKLFPIDVKEECPQ